MSSYSQWTWSAPHGRHYSYLLAGDGKTILETIWSGPGSTSTPEAPAAPTHQASQSLSSRSSTSGDPRRRLAQGSANFPSQGNASREVATENTSNEVAESDEDDECDGAASGQGAVDDQNTLSLQQSHSGSVTDNKYRHDSLMPDMQSLGLETSTVQHRGSFMSQGHPISQQNRPSQASNVNTRNFPVAESVPSHPIPGSWQGVYVQQHVHQTMSSLTQRSQMPASPFAAQGSQQIPSATARNHQTKQGENTYYPGPRTHRSTVASLPPDVQADIGHKDRRYIQTSTDPDYYEKLDTRFRRVAKHSHSSFFVLGRVFKMLWTEPAGVSNPGKTRNSSHFSLTWLNEHAYSEIRYFVVVKNKGSFSQCIPIQTYKGRATLKPGIVVADHGVVHTSQEVPNLLPGERLTKYSVRVQPTLDERLEEASRINYGKAYVVEHNVKVLDIGMVIEGHRYLIEVYFREAMGT